MADAQNVLCDVLCFLCNKFGKFADKTLKMTLSDFYSAECLAAAKNRLITDIDDMKLTTKRPHAPARRDGEGRIAREVDDLMLLFTFLDEQKVLDKLPRYVSDNPDNMPNIRLYEGDLQMFTSFLRDMNGRLNNLESVLAAICNDVRKLQVWPSLPEPARSGHQPGSSTQSRHAVGLSDVNTAAVSVREVRGNSATAARGNSTVSTVENETVHQAGPRQQQRQQRWGDCSADWAATGGSSVVDANRFAPLASASADDEGEPFNVVQGRRRSSKRHRQTTPEQSQLQRSMATTTGEKSAKPSGTVLLGKASSRSVSTKIAAAKKMRKKAVFCIDNVHTACTLDDIKSFVKCIPVEVVTCYEVQPRRFRNESASDAANDRKAFRLCIYDEDRDMLLNPSVWPDSVKISYWYFKSRSNDDSKRPRLSETEQNADTVFEHDTDLDVDQGTAMVEDDAGHENDNDDTILENYNAHDGE